MINELMVKLDVVERHHHEGRKEMTPFRIRSSRIGNTGHVGRMHHLKLISYRSTSVCLRVVGNGESGIAADPLVPQFLFPLLLSLLPLPLDPLDNLLADRPCGLNRGAAADDVGGPELDAVAKQRPPIEFAELLADADDDAAENGAGNGVKPPRIGTGSASSTMICSENSTLRARPT